ncbi:DNA phosphorothioation-dependent restriction protein DptF [Carnobacterium maltaromaticum]|uniref:DNA phosphorothioation-dependent restriction protein DptF n=1 Tax=Carnobacterium maltaromaticum TaxID=2751 RepID=UPI00165BA9A0|nr:DNA phosphorothioation-dependent restriction protein DptF [Carnobacterium maltaromaticum]
MEANKNKQFQILASNLYILISKKYDIHKGNFSSENLNLLAVNLGNRLKRISFDETNKILNVSRSLTEISRGYFVSSQELQELEELYSYFKSIDKNKQTKMSELESLFRKLSVQSKESIVNENEFDEFKEYMHIKRPIENEFEEALSTHFQKNNKSILFVVGNVGDGKSHILSYMMKKHSKVFSDYRIKIHNDATETDSPASTALETMKRILMPFSDTNIINTNEDRLVVAINLGILTNLIEELKKEGEYSSIVKFLEKSQILSSRELSEEVNSNFRIISFTEQKNFELIDGKIESEFYEEVINKIYRKSLDNPFYSAYKADLENGMNKLLHTNYNYMLRNDFQKSVIYLLTRAEIEHKIIVSTRMLFNFFYDISIPRDNKSSYDSYLPYLLFESANRSELLTIISTLDPIRNQTRKIDEISIELYHAPNTLDKISELLGDESRNFDNIFQSFKDKQEKFDNFINTYLRIRFLMHFEDELFDHSLFGRYLMFYFTVQEGGQVEELFHLVNESFTKWNGDSRLEGFIIKNPGKGRVKVLVEIDLLPVRNFISGTGIGLQFEANNKLYEVIIEYRTFEILSKLNNGYFLKEEDRQVAIKFDLFVSNIINSVKVMNKNILLDLVTQNRFELKQFMNKINLSKGKV